MSNLQIPDWNTFDTKNAFAYTVGDINSFTITAEFPAVADWDDPKLRARLHDRLHDDVTKLLRTAEFYSESSVEQRKGPDYFSIVYKDDTFDFEVTCHSNKLVLTKTGMSLSSFHLWYHAAVPSIKTTFHSLLDVLSKSLGRNQTITSVIYQFRFIAYDFVDRGKPLKNFQVISKVLTQMPNELGLIEDVPTDPKGISRLDYAASIWDGSDKDHRRRLSYAVSAPGNRSYTGLWFDFAYGSETYKDPTTGKREWVDPAILLDEYDRVYEFMWKRAVGGFMKSILGQLDFKTTNSYIP